MLYRSWIVKFLCVATLAFGSVACSSDSTTSNGTDDGDAAEESTEEDYGTTLAQTTVQQAVTVGNSIDTSVSSPELRFTITDISDSACPDGGTAEYDNDPLGIKYVDCTSINGDETTVRNGGYSISGSGSSFDLVYNEFTTARTDSDGTEKNSIDGSLSVTGSGSSFSIEFDLTTEASDTEDDSSSTFTISGTMTAEISGSVATITYENFEASVVDSEEGTYDTTADGELTLEGSVVNGDLTVTVNDVTVSCTFTDFDSSTATQADWDDACTVTS